MRSQGRVAKQENLGEAGFMETKFASLSRKISCRLPKGINKPLGAPRELLIHIHSLESRREPRGGGRELPELVDGEDISSSEASTTSMVPCLAS
jgi:hypothetical protein